MVLAGTAEANNIVTLFDNGVAIPGTAAANASNEGGSASWLSVFASDAICSGVRLRISVSGPGQKARASAMASLGMLAAQRGR